MTECDFCEVQEDVQFCTVCLIDHCKDCSGIGCEFD